MLKKFISTMLTLAMLCSFSIVPSAATSIQNKWSETVDFGDQVITYTHYDSEDTHFIEFQDNGKLSIVATDSSSGEVRLNGDLIAIRPTTSEISPQSNLFSLFSTKATRQWVLYDTDYSDITTQVINIATWTALLAGLLGVAASTTAVKDIAKKAVEDGLPTIYYEAKMYYIDPVTTSRPVTANYYTFYKNKNYTGKIGSYDCRYKL